MAYIDFCGLWIHVRETW